MKLHKYLLIFSSLILTSCNTKRVDLLNIDKNGFAIRTDKTYFSFIAINNYHKKFENDYTYNKEENIVFFPDAPPGCYFVTWMICVDMVHSASNQALDGVDIIVTHNKQIIDIKVPDYKEINLQLICKNPPLLDNELIYGIIRRINNDGKYIEPYSLEVVFRCKENEWTGCFRLATVGKYRFILFSEKEGKFLDHQYYSDFEVTEELFFADDPLLRIRLIENVQENGAIPQK